jgi:hypothetical protein
MISNRNECSRYTGKQTTNIFVTSGFRLDVDICTLQGYCVVPSGNPLPMFWDNVLGPSSRVKKSKKKRKPARGFAVYIGERVGSDW